jgi:hypothetical protein
MRHVWTILCSKATIDRESNNVSLSEVIERLEVLVPANTVTPVSFAFSGDLVTLWIRSDLNQPVRGFMRVRLLAPNGDTLSEYGSEVDLEGAARNRHVAHMAGLVVAGSGWHEFAVAHRLTANDPWIEGSRIPLEVAVVEDPIAAAPGAQL